MLQASYVPWLERHCACLRHRRRAECWRGAACRQPAAAAMRTPMLPRRGAQVFAVTAQSPADKAGIKPDEVVAAIDGTKITSARQAATMIRAGKVGDHITLTVYDITQGEVKPRAVAQPIEDEPVPKKKFSVHPPRR